MTRQCISCRRSSLKAVSRSHSNIATIRRQYVNLQNRWINGKRVVICTTCIKTRKKRMAKTAAPKTSHSRGVV